MPQGIEIRVRADGSRAYRAVVFDRRTGRKVSRSFETLAAARAWRADTMHDLRRGTLHVAADSPTLRVAADALVEGMQTGAVLARGGHAFKPSVTKSYRLALGRHVLPELGAARLADITMRDLHALVGRRRAEGLAPSTIRNVIAPLRVIYRRAQLDGTAWLNPTRGLELPASTTRRVRIADPAEAARLVAALPCVEDQAVWACAFYAGLRLGELRGLRWSDIDLDAGVLRVERSVDEATSLIIAPKTRSARRVVPLVAALRTHLVGLAAAPGHGAGFVFGSGERPFPAASARRRAAQAWAGAALDPIGFHEARHTYASLMIAAGVNAKALATFMGHASITITFDRYGHLMPGSEAEAGAMLDAFIDRSLAATSPELPHEEPQGHA